MLNKKQKSLSPKEERYCLEILAGKEKREAYRIAYGTRGNPENVGNRVHVIARIQELRKPIIEEAQMKAADVLTKWIDIAMADPNDIVQHRRTCCRFCYGKNNEYQWTAGEYASIAAQAVENNKIPPTCGGGFGFDANMAPHIACPECFGNGVAQVYFVDTRQLKGRAKALYAGVKKTSGGGVEVLLRNQDAALENIAKFLGMFKLQIGGGAPGEVPAAIPVDIKSVAMDALHAARIYQEVINGK